MPEVDNNKNLTNLLVANSRTSTFWNQAFAIEGSITPHVLPNVLIVGLFSWLITVISNYIESKYAIKVGLPLDCFEFSGAALGLLLVLRTNSGYDRWWEARKLWGGIVNQCRNLAISAQAYGPTSHVWQLKLSRLVAVFPHAAIASLRKESLSPQVPKLIGEKNAEEISEADHMPTAVALHIAKHLKSALDSNELSQFSFLQIDKERAQLIDHIGACERILKTPLPTVYAIKIRRFIAVFLLTLPFALLHTFDDNSLVPLVTMLVAYPLFSLDQIGVELQNPFNTKHLSHLPLDEISSTIERNVCALVKSTDLKDDLPETVTPTQKSLITGSFFEMLTNNFKRRSEL